MPAMVRAGLVLGLVLFVLAAAVVTVFAIGTPVAPQAPPLPAAPAGDASLDASLPAAPGGDVPAEGPLAIEIPGCVCHSDDPQVVAEHANYRMSECFDCHQGGMPGMGR